jgi:hypothetical protein
MSHLFFGDVLSITFLGPITGTGPLLLVMASWWSYHINVEHEIQTASRRPLTCIPVTFYHDNTRERPSIDFHGELPQDQSAMRNSRLNLPTELFAVVGGMGK